MFSNNRVEAFGYACALGFLAFVWPPLVLLGTALLAVVWANTRPDRETRFSRAVFTALGASLAAAKAGWRAVADEDQGHAVTDDQGDKAVTP